jgi:hypothetical protein
MLTHFFVGDSEWPMADHSALVRDMVNNSLLQFPFTLTSLPTIKILYYYFWTSEHV